MKTLNCCSNKITDGITNECAEFHFQKPSKIKFNCITKDVFDDLDNYLGQGVWNGRTLHVKGKRERWFFIEPLVFS